jgi:2-oxoisovalerate dehydrogenase E1 component
MRELTFTEAAREGLAEEMARDPSVFVVGEGIGARGGNFNTTTGLFERHGAERLRDTPITERGFTGLCTGAAMTGARPVVDYMFFDFALDALGELLNQTSKIQYMSDGRLRMPIVLRGCVGVGHSAATHHSGSYYPIFTNIPGFRVAVPTTPADAKGLLKTAIRSDDPVVFMEHRALLQTRGPVPDGDCLVPFGRAAVARAGSDVTVVGVAVMVQRAVAAAEVLAREGASIEVIDPRTLAPLDLDTILESVHKTGRLLIADESYGPCGIGAEIAAQVADRGFDDLDAPIRRLNGLHTPIPYSPPLEKAVVPDVEAVLRAIRDLRAE